MKRNRFAPQAERARLLGHHARQDRLGRRPREWRFAGEHFVQDGAERVNVRSRVQRAVPSRLFRTHVRWSPETHPRVGDAVGTVAAAHGQRDAEVGHKCLAVVEQDVVGLDIAVDHAVTVGIVERAGDGGGDPERVGDRKLRLALEPVAERFALDVGHDVENGGVDSAGINEGEDVGMLQVGGGFDLLQEPLGADEYRQLGAEHFERDPAVVAPIQREVDRGHAAGAQLTLDGVAVGQGCLEAIDPIGHDGKIGRDGGPLLQRFSGLPTSSH